MILDAHQHFWQYEPSEYDWIDEQMQVLRRNYLPSDLLAEITKAGIDGVVSVQARQSLVETGWLRRWQASNRRFAPSSAGCHLRRQTSRGTWKICRSIVQ